MNMYFLENLYYESHFPYLKYSLFYGDATPLAYLVEWVTRGERGQNLLF